MITQNSKDNLIKAIAVRARDAIGREPTDSEVSEAADAVLSFFTVLIEADKKQ